MILALAYAFIAGLHTVYDFDMGWHLATGRYVVQHHAIPSTDVLSHTSPGAEWIYPPFAGVILYGIFSAWGCAGLSWFCALALVAMVACLLRRLSRRDSCVAAVLAILAVPSTALRTTPRADLFTALFFAIFLTQLWSFHRSVGVISGDGLPTPSFQRERLLLWMLPLLMLFWVNLHPGFVAGLGLLIAYLLIESLDLLFPLRRQSALQRLRQAWLPLAATVVVTLFNPYGPRIYEASLLLAGVQRNGLPSTGLSVGELEAVPISLASMSQALHWRNPASSYWWMVLVAVTVVALAIWRRQLGAALLLAAALFVSLQHLRHAGLFSIVVVVVGSTILTEAIASRTPRAAKLDATRSGALRWLPVTATCALCLLTSVRMVDLVTCRSYVESATPMVFGAGESWWFPERAAAFIQRERVPGNIFQNYDLGGFTAWRLGPTYGDFIDGRNVSPAVWIEQQELLNSPPDSSAWEAESNRRNVNILLFSLARISGVGSPSLMSLCQSRLWRPVYLDEVSIVLLRNRSENRPWIDRYEVDCRTHNFPPPLHASRMELSNFHANAGTVLWLMGRYSEAKESLDRALVISPEDPTIHLSLAQLYEAQQQLADAEREYLAALSAGGDLESTWYAVGRFYALHGRFAEARPFAVTATQLSANPSNEYSLLGTIDTSLRQPQKALIDYSKAEEAGKLWKGREDLNPQLFAQIAEGRAVAYAELGEWRRAIEFQQEATRITPGVAGRWRALALICEGAGQQQLAEQARQQALTLSNGVR